MSPEVFFTGGLICSVVFGAVMLVVLLLSSIASCIKAASDNLRVRTARERGEPLPPPPKDDDDD